MVCPECGEYLHRSHSRNFRESLVKTVTSYKTYRCSECGWRGLAAPVKSSVKGGRLKTILFWVAGLIIALIIGIFAVYDLQSSVIP
jgi:hypothetical protein